MSGNESSARGPGAEGNEEAPVLDLEEEAGADRVFGRMADFWRTDRQGD
jgi:hypothetical protein